MVWIGFEIFQTARRYFVGVALLLGVVFLWTFSNFITNGLETGKDAYNKPFLITYLNTAAFTLYLIPSLWRYHNHKSILNTSNNHPYEPIAQSDLHHEHDRPEQSAASVNHGIEATSTIGKKVHSVNIDKLTLRETANIAIIWAIIWFAANWSINASLGFTSVASVTIISGTSGFFTLALGRIVGVETLTRLKVVAVILSFLGVVLVTKSDSNLPTSESDLPISTPDTITPQTVEIPTNPLLGDFAALLSSFLYAVYVILLKKKIGDEERADMQLMLGLAGLFSTTLLLPLIPILHYLDIETFQLPPTPTTWIICLLNFIITLTSDYMYMLAMLKTTPMLATVGLSLTIPLALVGSLFIPSASGASITMWSLGGAGMVIAGFGMLGWQGWNESRETEDGESQSSVR